LLRIGREIFNQFTNDDLPLLSRAAVLVGANEAIARLSGLGGTNHEFQVLINGLEAAALQSASIRETLRDIHAITGVSVARMLCTL
jgi:hypothetical protein